MAPGERARRRRVRIVAGVAAAIAVSFATAGGTPAAEVPTVPAAPAAPVVEVPAEPPAPVVPVVPGVTGDHVFFDDFDDFTPGEVWEDSTVHGQWRAIYDGYGQTSVVGVPEKMVELRPMVSTAAGETHAGLVATQRSFGDVDLSVRVLTVAQLRVPAPNPWEVGWVLWGYTDNLHFYSVVLKPNGWEIGKEDPAYPGAQRFLATGSTPTFQPGTWHTVRVRQVGNVITVWADGVPLATLRDTERPYRSGAVALYSEDAAVRFDEVAVTTL